MALLKSKKPSYTTIENAPEWLRVPYIHKGYRINHHVPSCVDSLVEVHNETFNIWSHLIAGVVFLAYMQNVLTHDWSVVSFMDIFMPLLQLSGDVYGLLASSIFHSFNCINYDYWFNLRVLDFCGIGLGILAGSWPVAFYTFYCSPTTLAFYNTSFVILTPIVAYMPFAQFFHDRRLLRTFLYILIAWIPLYCGIQFYLMEGNFDHPLWDIYYTVIVKTYIFYGVGVTLYVTRIPERFYPGLFDYLGTSHQIWHLLVVLGHYYLYWAMMEARQFRMEKGCGV
eukprot:TRINITY_DN2141_c0_g1_i1.p1 TRINITY_DN2141_c0_g1~~TRINITY_DN2141_c0_g1_i1.p1  ORF type:complete len:282 (+),score=40.11 TRINITY_DN2141_c0_g1_i1:34-879(+)